MGNATRIKVIEAPNGYLLQKRVNEFLSNLKERLVDIKYLSSRRTYEGGETERALVAIIQYLED